VYLTLLEDAGGELASLGDDGVLNWPATIAGQIGLTDATFDVAPDLDASTDLTIEAK